MIRAEISGEGGVPRWTTLLASLIMVFLCVGCTDPDQTRIAEACTRASRVGDGAEAPRSAQRCSCIAATAKKYLDKKDYALLAKVSAIYVSSDDGETKLHGMINTLVDSGLSPTRASLVAMDFMFLARKIDLECNI